MPEPLWVSIPIVALFLLLEGFFSGTEIAFLSLPPVKGRGDSRIRFFIENADRLLATTLLGTNLCVIANSSYITYLMKKHLGIGQEFYIVLVVSPLVLVLGETIPKTIARNRPELVARTNVALFSIFYRLFLPVTGLLIKLLRMMGQEGLAKELIIKREDLPHIIDTHEETDIKEGEKELIASILKLKEIRAREVMKPIIHVRTLEAHHSVKMAVETFNQTGYTRLPVYEEHIYNIRGILNVFDVLDAPMEEEVGRHIKRALFVPETETVWMVLKQMQESKSPIAIVVDEYGAASGLITVEDVLEELVGEIADEYDLFRDYGKIEEREDGTIVVPGDIPVDVVNERAGLELPEGEAYETVAGLVMYLMDRMPKVGERVFVGDYQIEVVEADHTHIKKLEIRRWKRD